MSSGISSFKLIFSITCDNCDHIHNHIGKCSEEEQVELLQISFSYAFTSPWTVMIVSSHANPALVTMMSSSSLENFAVLAEPKIVKLKILFLSSRLLLFREFPLI